MGAAHRSDYPYAVVPQLPDGDVVDLQAFLPGSGPLELELGPGRGAFLLERCAAAPAVRLLGIEIRRKWARIVDDRLRRQGYGERARVVCHDARAVLRRLGPDGAVASVFIHFPDPWWKKRHQKRLLVAAPLLDELCRLLQDGGALFLQTDVLERADGFERALGARAELQPAGDQPGSPRLSHNPYEACSNREKRVVADGLPVHRLRYCRRAR